MFRFSTDLRGGDVQGIAESWRKHFRERAIATALIVHPDGSLFLYREGLGYEGGERGALPTLRELPPDGSKVLLPADRRIVDELIAEGVPFIMEGAPPEVTCGVR